MARETDDGVNLLEIDPGEDHEQDGHEGADRDGNREEADGADKDKDKGKEKDPRDEALRETRRALKESRLANKQVNETAQFWMNEARRTAAPGGRKEKEEEPDVKISVDLVEAVSSGNAADIRKAMKEMGFVSQKEMDAAINQARSEVTTQSGRDAQLYNDYPDLADDKSEMFKATARIYNELAADDPMLAKSGSLAKIAAALADKELGRKNGDRDRDRDDDRPRRRATSRRADPDLEIDDEDREDPDEREDREDREKERVARVGRQSGDRGRRATGRGERDNDTLDATQKTIVAKLKAAGADISEEGYRKRALAGVRMSGMPTRRPRY
jgi:hypothetical protein